MLGAKEQPVNTWILLLFPPIKPREVQASKQAKDLRRETEKPMRKEKRERSAPASKRAKEADKELFAYVACYLGTVVVENTCSRKLRDPEKVAGAGVGAADVGKKTVKTMHRFRIIVALNSDIVCGMEER